MGRLRTRKDAAQKPDRSQKVKSGHKSGGVPDNHDSDLVGDAKCPAGELAEDPSLVDDVARFLRAEGQQQSDSHSRQDDPLKQENSTDASGKKRKSGKLSQLASSQSGGKSAARPSKSSPGLIVPPDPHWYSTVQPLSSDAEAIPPDTSKLSSLTSRAAELHAKDVADYRSSMSSMGSSSDATFLARVLHSGTLSDRLSALTLLVQGSPLHNTQALETLRGMAERGRGKGGRDESLKALRCIVDWWTGGGAPDRKLKYFRDQPLSHPGVTDAHLVVWYFEDWLKKYFFAVLQSMEALSLDPLSYVRLQSLAQISICLRDKPEQEQNLLRLLINKLGDIDRALCSRASYHILQILQKHPSMKTVMLREIVGLVLRSSTATLATAPSTNSPHSAISGAHIRFEAGPSEQKTTKRPTSSSHSYSGRHDHVRYYSVITCNQFVLAPNDKAVAIQLVEFYFEIFKDLLGRESEARDGIPLGEDQAPDSTKKGREGRDERPHRRGGRRGDNKHKASAKQNHDAGFAEVEDSSSRLVSAVLTGINRALPFARMSATDSSFTKHMDSLFFITHTSTFNVSIQALALIFHVCTTMGKHDTSVSSSTPTQSSPQALDIKPISDRFYRTLYASMHDPRLVSSSKQAMYLNLLFRAVKNDHDARRVKAFVRRFVQTIGGAVCGSGGGAEFIAGGLYLLSELMDSVAGLRELLTGLSEVPDEGQAEYDPRKREPQYANASSCPMWELFPLLSHYHPTIALNTRQILDSLPITTTADLSLNTITHFLDRFVYKNPKQLKSKGSSAMQPAASANDGTSVKLIKGEARDGIGLMNEDAFLRRRLEDIPVDQRFFHQYFSSRKDKGDAKAARTAKRHSRRDDDQSSDSAEEDSVREAEPDEDDSGSESMDEKEIWKAMKATMMNEGPVDEDDDGLGDDGLDEDSASEGQVASDATEGTSDSDLPLEDDSDIYLSDELQNDEADQSDDSNEWVGLDSLKRKRTDKTRSSRRRQKVSTFASYQDYADMIDNEPDE